MLAGSIGISIYGLFLFYTLYQLKLSSIIKKRIVYFNYKRSFHFIFTLFSISQIIFYTNLLYNPEISMWGFVFLDISSFLQVMLFAMVINLWGYALNYSNYYHKSTILGICMIILNIASTISSLLYLAINGSIALSSNRSNFIGFLIVSIPHLGSLLIFSSILLLYSIRLVSTLSQSYGPQFPQLQSDIEIKIKLIIRIIFVACVCICCYLLRIIVFAIAIYDVLYRNTHSSLIFYNTSHVAWYLLIDWIPSLGPGVIFLYFMQTTRVKSSSSLTHSKSNQSFHVNNSNSNSLSDAAVSTWYYDEKYDYDDDDDNNDNNNNNINESNNNNIQSDNNNSNRETEIDSKIESPPNIFRQSDIEKNDLENRLYTFITRMPSVSWSSKKSRKESDCDTILSESESPVKSVEITMLDKNNFNRNDMKTTNQK